MTCNRCDDIHKAQREGKTQRPCGCRCHDNFYIGTDTGTATTTGNIRFTSDNTFWQNTATGSALDITGNEA